MKLAEGFITQEVAGEQIMVSADSGRFLGMVRSNRTAAFIVDCLKRDTNPEELEAQMLKQFDAPRELVRRDIEMVLEKLSRIGALVETTEHRRKGGKE